MQPKRILVALLAVILICLSAGTLVSAAEASPLNLAVTASSDAAISKSPVTVQAGDTLEVSVTVTENPGIATLQFDLKYDSTVLSVKTDNGKIAYKAGEVFAEGTTFVVSENVRGTINVRILASADSTVTGKAIITIPFTVSRCAESTKGKTGFTLTTSSDYAANAAFDNVNVTLANDGKTDIVAHGKLNKVADSEFPCLGAKYECETCKEQVYADGTEAHKPGKVEAVAPKCGVVGWTEGEACTVCSFVFVAPTEVTALEHLLAPVEAQAPDCENAGWEAYDKCTREGCDYSTKVEIPALEHDLVDVEAKPVTCTEDGWNAHQVCQREGCDYSTKELIEANGSHTPVTDPAVEPTYSSEGKTEGSHCEACGQVLVPQETIPAKSLLWLWILIAVVVVAGAGAAVYFFVIKKNNNRPQHIGRPGSQK